MFEAPTAGAFPDTPAHHPRRKGPGAARPDNGRRRAGAQRQCRDSRKNLDGQTLRVIAELVRLRLEWLGDRPRLVTDQAKITTVAVRPLTATEVVT